MVKTVTADIVWKAYRSLWQYAKAIKINKGAPIPTWLPSNIPPKKEQEVSNHLALLNSYVTRRPLKVDVDYYIYLYLFAQQIRCSLAESPYFKNDEEGWKNLRWLPLNTLLSSAKESHWDFWHKTHKMHSANQLSKIYPILLDPGIAETIAVDKQLDIILKIMEKQGINLLTAWRDYGLHGERRNTDQKNPWHIHIAMVIPEAWDTNIYPQLLGGLIELINNEVEYWSAFVYQTIPLLVSKKNLGAHKAKILAMMDRIMRIQNDAKLKARWKILRRRMLPFYGKN